MTRRSSAFFALLLFIPVASAQSPVTFWSGATSTDWNAAGNWNNGVPGDSDSVRFNPSPTRTTLDLGGGTSASLAGVAFSGGGGSAFTLQSGTLLFNNNGEINVTIDAPTGLTQTVTMTTRFQGVGRLTNDSITGAVLSVADVGFATSSATRLTVGGPGAVNVTGTITDATGGGVAGLTKTGTGTLTLGGANTYSGTTVVSGGVVSASNLAALGQSADDAANLTLDGGTLRHTGSSGGFTNRLFTLGPAGGTLNASGTAVMSFGGTGGVAFSSPDGPTTLTLTGTGTGALAPALGDNGTGKTGLTKTGAGTWSLNGTSSFSGAVAVQQGTLWLARAGSGGANAAYTLSAGATLAVGSGRSDTVAVGSLAGDGTVTASRAGGSGETNTLAIGGGGTSTAFAGALQNSSHILALTKTGAGTLTLTGTSTYTGGTTVSAGTLQVGSGGKSGSIVGAVTNNAALAFNRSDDLTFGGAVGGSGSLTKAGAGTLTLTGTSTYAGATQVSAGTLLVNGALGKTDVTVNAGAALGGFGTIDVSTVSVAATGAVFGGDGSAVSGKLTTLGNLSLATGATLRSVAGTGGASRVAAVGDFTVGGPFAVELGSDGTLAGFTQYTRTLAGYGRLVGIAPGTQFTSASPGGYSVTAVGTGFGISEWVLTFGANELTVTFTPVPEPGLVLGLAAAGMGFTRVLRRRKPTPR